TLVDSKFNLGGFGAHSGNSYAALGAVNQLGTVTQVLTTKSGQVYTLDFFLASDGFTPSEFRADWNGTTVFDQTNIPRMGYTEFKIPVLATGAASTLTLFQRNDPGYLSLDDVSVTAGAVVFNGGGDVTSTPEPGSLTLLAIGCLGVGGVTRLRNRRSSRAQG